MGRGENYQLGSLLAQVGTLLPDDDPKLIADCQATAKHIRKYEDSALLADMIGLQDYV